MTRALLEQALEALECAYSENYDGAKIHGAKVAIRAHLAQPQGEPVAWGMPDAAGNIVDTITALEKTGEMKKWEDQYHIPLFTHPAHTEQEVQEILDASYRESGALVVVVRRILGVPAQ